MTQPGMVVLDITCADEETVITVISTLEQVWATSGIVAVYRDPGQPGVRARLHADIHRHGPAHP